MTFDFCWILTFGDFWILVTFVFWWLLTSGDSWLLVTFNCWWLLTCGDFWLCVTFDYWWLLIFGDFWLFQDFWWLLKFGDFWLSVTFDFWWLLTFGDFWLLMTFDFWLLVTFYLYAVAEPWIYIEKNSSIIDCSVVLQVSLYNKCLLLYPKFSLLKALLTYPINQYQTSCFDVGETIDDFNLRRDSCYILGNVQVIHHQVLPNFWPHTLPKIIQILKGLEPPNPLIDDEMLEWAWPAKMSNFAKKVLFGSLDKLA